MHYKAVHAFGLMVWGSSKNQNRYSCTSKLYEKVKKDFQKVMSLSQSKENNSQYGIKWAYNQKLKISQRMSVDKILPSGWEWGRIIKFKKHLCLVCNKPLSYNRTPKLCLERYSIISYKDIKNNSGIRCWF